MSRCLTDAIIINNIKLVNMAKIDFSKYNSVDQIVSDIKDIKIQGATNVAIATFEGIKLFIQQYKKDVSPEVFISDVEKVGISLAEARPNEPLAKNGLRYLAHMIRVKHPGLADIDSVKQAYISLTDDYLGLIESTKKQIIDRSASLLKGVDEVVTHCHSSTVEKVIINQSKKVDPFYAICTETRPLFQGRITAKHLLEAGIDTTMVADSAVESFIIGRGSRKTDVVFIGCDQISMNGDAINKIGSWGVAIAAYYANIPLYVVGTILKTDVSTAYKPIEIEMRDAKELWEDAPEGLKMINPAFELVNKEFITGYMTEFGLVSPDDIGTTIQENYGWLF